MTAQSQPGQPRQQRGLSIDRTTAIGIGSLTGALLILIALITLITLLPAQLIRQTMSAQGAEREKLLGTSLSRQMESYFSGMALDVVSLANRSDIRSIDKSMRSTALSALDSLGSSARARSRLSSAYPTAACLCTPGPTTGTEKSRTASRCRGRSARICLTRLSKNKACSSRSNGKSTAAQPFC